ncbi:DLIC-domain-containing protein [Linnemannia elongata AG-77]|uniref:DLIC-domain-containing protein n=1 Tax=Linnemannia elongata AG-77 TaxID=1314771 RepID=A0A197JUR3_9FUNG|nr:DLIC-domain-containing protein [Linnemannia elongata AG-77]
MAATNSTGSGPDKPTSQNANGTTTATTNGTVATGAAALVAGPNSANTEVWSSLLKSVASSRLVPAKDVIILGDPHSGKSTLIDLLKTALPEPSSDALANGVDGSGAGGVNGHHQGGANGVANSGNGSAPVMVEMGTGTSEDNMFAGAQKKNDLALSYSFWNVEDDENEETVARLGIYQVAGSHKSYHALLKYCLNTKTVADSVIMIVLDWAKPWTFMETLERWIKVLEGALQQICQEGAVATATWTKGKALMDELQEKLARFLQEYTEPQPHPSIGSAIFSESQTFNLGSTDAQSVLLPLTDGCLTNNTGVPIVIVCTKSDHINSLEREQDYQEETFDYIQQSLRTICLKYGASLFYTSIHHPHTFANLRQYLLHRLLTPSTLNNTQIQQPSNFHFKKRAQVVERDQVMVPAGWDSIGKIKVLRNGFDCEGVADGWDKDAKGTGEGEAADGPLVEGARKVYEETIVNPKRSHAPITIQPIITAEDDQVFLDRFFETLQRSNERSSLAPGSSMGGAASAGLHGAHGTTSGPPVVGPLGSGYTPMLNSHHASSPPPTVPVSSVGSAGAGGRPGVNGYDSYDVEARLKGFTSNKTKVNGGASGMIGPALTGESGSAAAKFMMMMEQGRTNSGSPPASAASATSLGGMASSGAMAGRPGAAGAVGAGGVPGSAPGVPQTEALSNFFQSLMTRKGTMPSSLGTGVGAAGASASAPSAASSISASASASAGPGGSPANNDS